MNEYRSAQPRAFLKNESGASAIEYALIAALLSVTVILSVGGVGNSANGKFDDMDHALQANAGANSDGTGAGSNESPATGSPDGGNGDQTNDNANDGGGDKKKKTRKKKKKN